MKNVFLDLGTHIGQGLEQFMHRFQMNDTWTIHTFEANPVVYKIFLEGFHKLVPWVKAHNLAVTNYHGTITVNIETPPGEGDTGQGTSVINLEQWNPWGGILRDNFQRQAVVGCIDLSQFIIENFSKDDNIIIKMDIEGSEYDTLEKMIETGAIEYVNVLVVEWHSRYFTNTDEIMERERLITEKINGYNIMLHTWF